jgi:hypothetical protein
VGGAIFDRATKGTAFEGLDPGNKAGARKRFEDEWAKLAMGLGGIMTEGRLWVGIGTKI